MVSMTEVAGMAAAGMVMASRFVMMRMLRCIGISMVVSDCGSVRSVMGLVH